MLVTQDNRDINILCFNENKNFLSYLKQVFFGSDLKINIDTTPNPKIGLLWYKTKKYDVIICDYSISKFNGIELLKIIRHNGNMIPFIMFIEELEEETISKILKLGVNLYVQNKYDINALTLELNTLIHYLAEKKNHYVDLAYFEQQYKALAENSTVGFWYIKINGNLFYMNKAMMSILNIESKDEINWVNSFPFVSIETQAVLINKKGKKCYGIISSIPLKDKEGNLQSLMGTFTDLNKLIENQNTFDTLIELLPLGVFVTRKSDSRILYTNTWGSELIGLTKEQLINSDGLVFCQDSQKRKEFIEKINNEQIIRNYSVNSLKVDNTSYWIEASSRLIRYKGEEALLNVVNDITERKRDEQQQKATMSRLKALISHLPYGIFFEDENRRVIHINQQLCNLYKLSHPPKDYIGLSVQEFILILQKQFLDPGDFIFRIEEILTNKSFSFNNEFKLADGRVLESISIPIYFEKEYYGQLWQVSDITSRKINEDKLEREKSELSSFAHEMAHDLRNFFTAIEGYSVLLKDESCDSHYVDSIIKLVQDSQMFLKQSLKLAEAGKIIDKKYVED